MVGSIGHNTVMLTVTKMTAAMTLAFTLTRRANIHNSSGANTTGYNLAPTPSASANAAPTESQQRRAGRSEFVARRFKWQKARQLEVHVDFPIESAAAKETEDKLDRVETQNPKLLSEIQRVIAKLPPLQRDIWYAYAFAGNLTPDAGALGVELGMKYENGVPIPAGTIRVYKSRAIGTVKAEMKKLGYDLDRLEGRS